MLTNRGFSAWIEVDGEPLQEFMVSLDEESNVSQCFIGGEEGSRFVVHWKDHDTGFDSIGFIGLDGYTVPGRFLFGSGQTYRSGARVSKHEERPFKFLKAPIHGAPQSHYLVGTVKLTIKRIRKEGSVKANDFTKLPRPQLMKGNDISVGFGQEEVSYEQYAYTWGVHPHPEDNVEGKKPATWATFIFKYRTRDWLREQGILPMARKQRPSVGTSENRVASGSGLSQTPVITTAPTPRPPSSRGPSSSTAGKKSSKSFGELARGPSGEKAMPSSLPVGTQRSSSGRVVSVKPGSMPGEGLLCFDDDIPEEHLDDKAESPPLSQYTDSGFGVW
ncbi:hypothetical protein DL96DRAFT_1605488 [Flagelloscypha sp. PMI_526]|nr:hypothetical protein DL96DRAFT_1605488 [Flagelloscypha sp. PMI_526]